MGDLRDNIEAARRNAAESAEYADAARGEVARLLGWAESAGRPATTKRLGELMALVVASGIKAEQANGHAQIVAEWFGHEPEPVAMYFGADLARPLVQS